MRMRFSRFENAEESVSVSSANNQYLRLIHAAAALLLLGAFVHSAAAQNYLTSTGSPSFSAPEPADLGFVDAANGNIHLSIPLGSYPQRGGSGRPQAISLEYDSNIWTTEVAALGPQWVPYNSPAFTDWNGWYLSYDASDQTNTIVEQGCYTDFSWADQNGTFHMFHLNESDNNGCPTTADAFATDSSGYHLYATAFATTPPSIYAPDGTLAMAYQIKDPQGHYIVSKDSNGNYISADSIVPSVLYDTLGRTIAAGSSGFRPPTVTMMTSMGTSAWSITTASVNVTTNFKQSGIQEVSGFPISVIRSLKLPDAAGSTYYFTYDCDSSTSPACGSPSGQSAYYGELIGITLPTGGQIRYYYTTFKDAYGNMSQWVTERTSQGGGWTYSPQVLSTCSSTSVNCKQQTTVSSPAGLQTIYTFQLNNGAWPISVVKKDASGNTLTSVANTWDMSQPCVLIGCHGNAFIRLLTQQTTVYTPSGSLTNQVTNSYDSPQSGNRTAIKQWKFISGTGFSSVPDRATYTTYLTTGTNNINRPLSVTLCNNSGSDSACPGGGSKVSQTLYHYDNYGSNGLKGITGIAQHDDSSFGTGYTTRGNMTSEDRWVSGSTYLTSSYTYDTTGQVLSSIDPAGNSTLYSYADNFFTDPGNNATPTPYTPQKPTNAYSTKVTDPIGSETKGYYWGSGKASIASDYNSASSYIHYQDGLDRKTEEINPIGWKLATYTSAEQTDMYSAVGDASPSTGCSSCQHTQSILDGWGRKTSLILTNNPIGPTNIDSTYDSSGRLSSQSHEYSGSADPNHVFEVFAYDSLGRQISATHPDGQAQRTAFGPSVNGLGGLTSQQGSAATYGYGYPQIVEDEAGHQRQQWNDGFGQIIEVDEPSTSTASFATVTVSISNGGGPQWQTFDPCQPHASCPQTIPNSGEIYLTVNGYTASTNYGPNGSYPSFMPASTVASNLAAAFNGDANSPVTAAASGASIILTAKGPGVAGNVAFSSSATFYNQSCPPYNPCFGGPAYAVSPTSGSLNGGSGGIGTSPLYTNYTYDAADHLTKVVQGSETRTFVYDGLGRKTSETTPEAGTVTFSYTTSGGTLCSGNPSNVCRRTDARGVVSTYSYYANRLSGVSYTIPGGENIASMPNVCTTTNGTSANVCYLYDQGGSQAYAIGRLTEMIDPTGSESSTYYSDGHVKQVSKVTSGQTYNLTYKYDPGGDVTQITYPSGRVVYQAYNAVGQLCQISPSSGGCGGSGSYAGGFSYSAPGQMTGFTYGNGVAASFGYSAARTQLTSLKYSLGTQTYFSLGYWYQQNSPNCSNGALNNNGTVQCITDAVDAGRSVSYSYDSLSRLSTAKSNGSTGYAQWGLAEAYDRYGNRQSQTVTAGSGPSSNLTFNSNNQPIGYTFDSSGNMTVEPLSPPNNMTYDGENRITAFSGNGGAASYTYDGNGLRVIKTGGGTTTVSVYSDSSVIAEYDNGAAPSSPSREYIYNSAGGQASGMLALISSGATTYAHQDHLSVRFETNSSGSIITQEGHYPFGEKWYISGPTNKWFFTSYQRDSESGLDYALARYYDSRTGTFASPDPLPGSSRDPQSWNRYAYGRNDPIDIIDPSGKNWLRDFLRILFGDPSEPFGGEPSAEGSPSDTLPPPSLPGIGGDWSNAMSETLGMPSGWVPPAQDPVQELAHELGWPSLDDVGCLPECDVHRNYSKYHCDVFGNCSRVHNNPLYNDWWDCLFTKGGAATVLDFLGMIPGEGTAVKLLQLGGAAASLGIAASGDSLKDASTASAGFALSAADATETTASKAIPIIGNFISAYSFFTTDSDFFTGCMNSGPNPKRKR